MRAIAQFILVGLLGCSLLLAGCGGGGAPTMSADPEETHAWLAALPEPGLTFRDYREASGDFSGSLGNPAAEIAADAQTARWLPCWLALRDAALTGTGAVSAEVGGVPTTCTFAPSVADPLFPYAVSISRADVAQPIMSGTLGETGARLLIHDGAQTLATLTLTKEDVAHTVELQSAHYRVDTRRTLGVGGSLAAARTSIYAVNGSVETLTREMRFDATGNAAPPEMADARYAGWEYHPTQGEPGTGLRAKIFSRFNHSGVLYVYQYGGWQTILFSPI